MMVWAWFLRASRSFTADSYLYLPKSMSLQTGGRAMGATSTRSRSDSPSQSERILDADDADLFAVGSDQTHLGDANSVVNAGLDADGHSLRSGLSLDAGRRIQRPQKREWPRT